ncbi:hypothetical protein ScalyP_jg1454, partial [Parmales sp. scaly parma]
MTSRSTKRNPKASQKAKEGVSDEFLELSGYHVTGDDNLPPGSEIITKDNHFDLYDDSSDSSEEGDAPTTFLRRSSSSYSDNSLLSPTQTT